MSMQWSCWGRTLTSHSPRPLNKMNEILVQLFRSRTVTIGMDESDCYLNPNPSVTQSLRLFCSLDQSRLNLTLPPTRTVLITRLYFHCRYLELQSSGRRNEIRIHYSYIGPKNELMVHMESFPYRLADNKWHKIALSISGTEIQLIVDCHPLYKRECLTPGGSAKNTFFYFSR